LILTPSAAAVLFWRVGIYYHHRNCWSVHSHTHKRKKERGAEAPPPIFSLELKIRTTIKTSGSTRANFGFTCSPDDYRYSIAE
tara:strand:+ start:1217 stop:1465 length:249 start_codon:yes stop_codon:yes gene_type:complete